MATAESTQSQHLKANPAANMSRRRKLTWLARLSWGGALLFVLALVAVAAIYQVREQDQIRAGVSVFGVDVSGMTVEEARAAVRAETEARAARPLVLVDRETTWEVTQREVGLRFDVDAAVADAFDAGRSGHGPGRLAVLWHLRDGSTSFGPAHVSVATDAAQAVLTGLASDIYLPTIQPDFSIDNEGRHHYVAAQTGRELDVEASRDAIVQALADGAPSLDLTVAEYPPVAENSDYAPLLAQAENALDEPITLVAGDQSWTFTPVQIASRLTIVTPSGGAPAHFQLDEAWAINVIDEIGWAIDRSPQSPRVWWDASGALVVVEHPQAGYVIEAGEALQMASDAFAGNTNGNTITLPVTVLLPPSLPADLNALGLTAVIAESSTPYGGSIDARKHNIEQAAKILNGVLIMPGQTFSFNSEIGPMTVDAGFQVAYGIANLDGQLRTIPTEAGGICQVATTVFQPVFATGYEIVQRTTHSYWIPSYTYNGMVGLDATVDPDSGLDLKWTNNSEHAVLIQAEADDDNFTVRLIGQRPAWEVKIDEPDITNIDWADDETVYYEPDTSIPVGQTVRIEHAHEGFDIRIVRTVTSPDGSERIWDGKMSYGKSRNVVLVGSEDGELPADFVPPSP